MPRPYIHCKWCDIKNLLSAEGARWLDAPAPISTVNGMIPLPVNSWRWLDSPPLPIVSWRWLDAPSPISTINCMIPLHINYTEGSLMPWSYIYSKWPETSYLLSAEGGLMPFPQSTVNGLTHPYLLSAEGGLMPPISTINGMMPLSVICWRWLDAPPLFLL